MARRLRRNAGGTSVPMRPAASAAATAGHTAGWRRRRAGFTGGRRGEDGEFFGQFGGAAMRAFGSLPIAGAHEDFTILCATFAMKFVDRHGLKISQIAQSSSPERLRKTHRTGRAFPHPPGPHRSKSATLHRATTADNASAGDAPPRARPFHPYPATLPHRHVTFRLCPQ